MNRDADLTKPACRGFEALLEDYLNGELAAAVAKRAAEHLKTCSACEAAFERSAAGARLLRAARPSAADPGPDFAHSVMARIRASEEERAAEGASFWQAFVSLGWRFAATAALALLALFTYDARWSRAAQPNAVALRPIDARDFLAAADPARTPASRDEALMMVAEDDHGSN